MTREAQYLAVKVHFYFLTCLVLVVYGNYLLLQTLQMNWFEHSGWHYIFCIFFILEFWLKLDFINTNITAVLLKQVYSNLPLSVQILFFIT